MAIENPKIFLTLRRSDVMIPLGCTMISQYVQDIYAANNDTAALLAQGLYSPFLLFSVLKVLALTTLIIYSARPLPDAAGTARRTGDLRKADRYLACILAANLALACLLVAAIRLTHAEGIVTLFGVPVTKSAVKVAFVMLLLAFLVPLNRRVFRDISLVIGSGAGVDNALLHSPAANRLFMRSLVRSFVVYVAPAFALHVLIVKLMPGSSALTVSMAMADSFLVGFLGLMAGYAISRSHEEVLARAG